MKTSEFSLNYERLIKIIFLLVTINAIFFSLHLIYGIKIFLLIYNYSYLFLDAFLFFSLLYIIREVDRFPIIILINFIFLIWMIFSSLFIYKISLFLFSNMITWSLIFIIVLLISQKVQEQNIFEKLTFFSFICLFICSIPVLQERLIGENDAVFSVYEILCLFPMVLLIKKRFLKNILIILSVCIMIISTKRTGILAIVTATALYYIVDIKIQKEINKRIAKICSLILTIILLFCVTLFLLDLLNIDIINRFVSLEQDGGSGRNIIWEIVWIKIQNSQIKNIIFGHGFHTVSNIYIFSSKGSLAHNDYLNIFYDFGILGLILYIFFVLKIAIFTRTLIKKRCEFAPAFIASFSIFLYLSMFSYCAVESKIINYLVFFWAFIMGISNNKNILRE
ncbi:hypothetical protein EUCA11A_29020 [Eubacterium callanderi]|uniref:O-antigen ligase family protein n=1 Tax=Eubacterium callanderi TaxID=53442 RepID=UPI0029FF52CB|nr:O-antigen ligase family protein [Eubacterium callanderi]WPK68728.1 hypothetical protein EUCA2A_29020 [Eubacterium callanderi]WPK73026.1 hypothetical protein EUCA11A_29020 [Eubacterium callanderi]